MPRVFKIGPYLVYFWSDEMEPLEPVHVHISQGEPEKNSTKVWITKSAGVPDFRFMTFAPFMCQKTVCSILA